MAGSIIVWIIRFIVFLPLLGTLSYGLASSVNENAKKKSALKTALCIFYSLILLGYCVVTILAICGKIHFFGIDVAPRLIFYSGASYFILLVVFYRLWSNYTEKNTINNAEKKYRIVLIAISVVLLFVPHFISFSVYSAKAQKLRNEENEKLQISEIYNKAYKESISGVTDIALKICEYSDKDIIKVSYVDSNNRLIKEETYKYTYQPFDNDEEYDDTDFTYSEICDLEHNKHIASAYVCESIIYNYDEVGRVESIVWNCFEGYRPTVVLESYSYDADGKLVKAKKINNKDDLSEDMDIGTIVYITDYYKYDINGNLIEHLQKNGDVYNLREKYEYLNGKLIIEQLYDAPSDYDALQQEQFYINRTITYGYTYDYISSINIECFDGYVLNVKYDRNGMTSLYEKYYNDSVCYETKVYTRYDSNGEFSEEEYSFYENGRLTKYNITLADSEEEYGNGDYYYSYMTSYVYKYCLESDGYTVPVHNPTIEAPDLEDFGSFSFGDTDGTYFAKEGNKGLELYFLPQSKVLEKGYSNDHDTNIDNNETKLGDKSFEKGNHLSVWEYFSSIENSNDNKELTVGAYVSSVYKSGFGNERMYSIYLVDTENEVLGEDCSNADTPTDNGIWHEMYEWDKFNNKEALRYCVGYDEPDSYLEPFKIGNYVVIKYTWDNTKGCYTGLPISVNGEPYNRK